MTAKDVRLIKQARRVDATVCVPPSKSYTNRALIVGALADGVSTIINPSRSDDSLHLLHALRQFGVVIQEESDRWIIEGTGGNLSAPADEVFIGNAGTAMRFLATFAALAQGVTTLNGDEQMKKRPIRDLLDALKMTGVHCSSHNGFPPVEISGGNFQGGKIEISGSVSSQFVSSLLLSAPYARKPVTLVLKGHPTSLPYIDMSMYVMRMFGADIDMMSPSVYVVRNDQHYIGIEFPIEADASSATYFLAAAAVTHGKVTIEGLPSDSLQGDLRFVEILSDMGCTVVRDDNTLELHGGKLFGIDIDMNEMPDSVPALAVVAAFAEGPTTISNSAHLRHKETDRLTALCTELQKIGARVEMFDDGLTIHPGQLHAATIETYNDHRMAMSFAVAGLAVQGIKISNPTCVSKSFPTFWDEFQKLET